MRIEKRFDYQILNVVNVVVNYKIKKLLIIRYITMPLRAPLNYHIYDS